MIQIAAWFLVRALGVYALFFAWLFDVTLDPSSKLIPAVCVGLGVLCLIVPRHMLRED